MEESLGFGLEALLVSSGPSSNTFPLTAPQRGGGQEGLGGVSPEEQRLIKAADRMRRELWSSLETHLPQ